MKQLDDTAVDSLTAISGISAMVHYATQVQPIISAAAGIAAVFSGVMAGVYYLVKTIKKWKSQ